MIRFAIALVACFPLLAYSQPPIPDYPVDKITEHTYVIHGPTDTPNVENQGFMNNPAFIVSDKGVIVVDPGSSEETGRMVMRQIKTITSKPITHIFNTHVHGDHWFGNDAIRQVYPNVVVMADPRMIKKAKAGEAQSFMDMLHRLTEGATKGTTIMYPTQEVKHAQELKINGFTFRMHVVGKAHSDVMIEFVEDSLMFTGDNVSFERIIRLDDGSFRDNIAACQHAIDLGLKHYVPGHGPTGDVNIVKEQKRYLDVLYSEAGKYYEEGLSDFEMKDQIVEQLTDFHGWNGFDEQVGKHISLAILEIERAAFQ